ncbi:ImmA/IrrE family metallo-endopeptidase [Streptomyces sp. NPDC056697]|uniref:ImmA/IrrE family metallo-endopeptidase n=1 Tax=Streptomyces sp. NPDC056697 TaxID=3345915 RepID=UPI003686654C
MSSIPDRVLSLIEKSGKSHSEFAQQVSLTEEQLTESLRGSRGFSTVEIARIAQTCQVSVKWLITGIEPPLTVAGRTTIGEAAEAVAVARQYTSRRMDLVGLGYPQPWRSAAVSTGGGSYAEQGERLARKALNAVAGAGGSVAEGDLAELIEEIFGADVAVAELGDGFDGLAAAAPSAKLILLAATSNSARQRFTLAHELGHLLAEDDQEVHLDRDVFDPAQKRDPSEQRANAFASSFLMPEARLREALAGRRLSWADHAALACELMVTPSALAYRLLRLRIIDAGMCDRYKRMTADEAADIAGRGEEFEQRAAASRTRRLPGPLLRDTYAAYEAGRTTLRPYATLLGADVDELRRELDSKGVNGGAS